MGGWMRERQGGGQETRMRYGWRMRRQDMAGKREGMNEEHKVTNEWDKKDRDEGGGRQNRRKSKDGTEGRTKGGGRARDTERRTDRQTAS